MLGVDLGDYFRGDRPWPQLYRFLRRLPSHGCYHSALAMNEELGRELAKQPLPEEIPPPSPLGYTLEALLLLRVIDLLKEQMRAYAAGLGGKLPPPFPPERRPMTAEQRIRDEQETQNVVSALRAMGIRS
ncbi:hypothetical protein SAMN05421776_12327 [Nocardia farcinica]|uniref:Uncharacterized protein n=3 Tax=Nocardia farcinica TaxID=37329 RepID=A0A0H5P9I3_NOCFR|nr:hypothetical protein CJ469_05969 [Nocardia farcinica]PFX04332.1 hypothetical protein CJ468_05578 [Nocardia farcinica]CRY84377.1 Uncharacterised protein [Nocardia farcinica]SIT34299.1 hypothetical protein SAMN05421776_12327 [Nocardia farcinica]SLG34163.1 Uncharacterised protein [Mycobacteroides abscessus subsp. abscessus]